MKSSKIIIFLCFLLLMFGIAATSSAASTIVQVRVDQSSDDAEEEVGGDTVVLDSSDLELIYDGGFGSDFDQVVGIRFQNVLVPVGATIQSAYIEFETDETSSEATSLTIYGQAADNPPTFTETDDDISGRTKTSASVAWSPDAWETVSEKHQTEDLSTIVQEIIDLGGWVSGNAMVFIVEGSGQRVARRSMVKRRMRRFS